MLFTTTYTEPAGLFAAPGCAARGPRSGWYALWRSVRTSLPLAVGDLAAVALPLAAIVMLAGFPESWQGLAGIGAPAMAAASGLAVLVGCMWGLYPAVGLSALDELRRCAAYATTLAAACLAVQLWVGSAELGTLLFLASWWTLAVPALVCARGIVRSLLSRSEWWLHPAVVVAPAGRLPKLALLLTRNRRQGLRPVAAVASDLTGEQLAAAVSTARDAGAGWLVLATDDGGDSTRAMDWAWKLGAPRLLVVDRGDHAASDGLARTFPAAALSGRRLRRLLSARRYRALKRLADVFLVLLLAPFLAPLLLLIVLAVALTSRGPILFAHQRIGRRGRHFRAVKFRTMRIDSDAVLAAHLASDAEAYQEWRLTHKLRRDPRVTAVGRLLRRTSLDELPQLWNVLRGDMSLVGPRPIIDAEVPRYEDRFPLYLDVRPGLTGLWQVSGRNDTSYGERVWLDSYYVLNWSPWMDLYILVRTMVTVLRGSGAY